MKSVRIISKMLLIITRVTALGYLLSFLLSSIAFYTSWSLNLVDKDTRFEIYYPFTSQPYLLGENNGSYILAFLMLLGLYTVFFFLAGNVFRIFTRNKLFTEEGIRQLKWFYVSNLILPSIAAILISPFYAIDGVIKILVTLHALLGVFTYFIAAIFAQGVKLQNEQDLII